MRDHGDAVVPGGHHDVEETADPGPVRGRPEAVAGLREAVVRVLHSRQVAEERAVRMQRALRLTGGAARVDDECRILGERVGDLETVRRLRGQRVEIERAFSGSVDAEDGLQVREAVAQLRDLGQLLAVGDDRTRAAVLQAELERLLAEQREERHGDHPGLPGGHVRDGGLVALGQQDGDPIAALQPAGDEHIGQTVGEH